MKRNTRLEILHTAKALFNERGFNEVSTADIAGALGISKGNLTYHFKRKEEIMEAIITEIQDIRPPAAPETLSELDAFFLNLQHVVKDNAFYFWHHAQLSQLSSKIRERQNSVYHGNVKKLSHAFQTLQENGDLRYELFAGEYDRVIDALILSSIYWIPFCYLKQEPPAKELPLQSQSSEDQNSYRFHAWAILYPMLTENGRMDLEKIISFPK